MGGVWGLWFVEQELLGIELGMESGLFLEEAELLPSHGIQVSISHSPLMLFRMGAASPGRVDKIFP